MDSDSLDSDSLDSQKRPTHPGGVQRAPFLVFLSQYQGALKAQEKKRIVELMKTARLKHYCCKRKIPCSGIVLRAPYMYVARKVSICMLYKYDVLMTSALPFTAIFWQIQNKDVKVGPCSKVQLLKLPCFRSLIIEIWRQ